MSKDDFSAANQETGAIIGLYNVYLLTRDEVYLKDINRKIKLLAANQSDEGWFTEYGGADFGYLSVAIDYLAKYHKKTGDEAAFNILQKAVFFLSNFIMKNGGIAGVCGSRNTDYIIPHGIEYMARFVTEAADFIYYMRKGVENGNLIMLKAVDDRYLAFIGYTFFQAYLDGEGGEAHERSKDGMVYFEKSGMVAHYQNDRKLVANLKKGASFMIELGTHYYHDSGIVIKSGHKCYFSGWLDNKISIQHEKDFFEVSGSFEQVNQNALTPFRKILLNTFQLVIGRNEAIALKIKSALRNLLITRKKISKIKFKREIVLRKDRMTVKDTIFPNGCRICSLYYQTKAAFIYVPSSRYFKHSDLTGTVKELKLQRNTGTILIKREFYNSGRVEMELNNVE